jgi:hypothetical protein
LVVSAKVCHREERSDVAIHKCKVGKQKWIASPERARHPGFQLPTVCKAGVH